MDSNNTNNESDTLVYPLNELLDSLGFLPINIYIYGIIIPIIASFGLILCLLSLWILSDKKFTASTYDYFRIITLSHIIQLAFAIPYGICFTPNYFPEMDSYSCAIVQSAYIPYSNFTSHLDAILEIAVLLERIKIMNNFVKKHFTITPRKMILITFFSCLLFNSIYGLVYVPFDGGNFYYSDRNGTQRVNSFWYVSTSELADSPIGVITLMVTFSIRDICTLITTIVLNVVSLFEMKEYFKTRRVKFKLSLEIQSITIQKTNNSSNGVVITQNRRQNFAEKNHLKLVLSMCFISIIMRFTSIACDVYYLFSSDYIATLLGAILDLVLVVGPTSSFFVFYNFNADFKKTLLNMVSSLDKKFREIYIE
jgi:hypothetical protein